MHHVLDLGPIRGVTIDDASGGGYGSLGFDTRQFTRRDWFEDMLTMLLAGRAAEALIFLEAGTGAGGTDDSDLARATEIAFAIERTLGLGQKFPLLYRPHPRPAVVLDADPVLAARVHGHLERAEARAGRLITDNRKAFDRLVEALIEPRRWTAPTSSAFSIRLAWCHNASLQRRASNEGELSMTTTFRVGPFGMVADGAWAAR